jgi:hypothetical protein
MLVRLAEARVTVWALTLDKPTRAALTVANAAMQRLENLGAEETRMPIGPTHVELESSPLNSKDELRGAFGS